MRLKSFITEDTGIYGPGITFMDIDETILITTARVKVVKNGEVIHRLKNHEFLVYEKGDPSEEFDFSEYGDAEFFKKTSVPVQKTVDRIKRMFQHIDKRGSKIIILTARADFDKKEVFLDTFRQFGIPIDDIYVERLGTRGGGGYSIPEKKKRAILKYLETGLYRRARLLDDSEANCRAFLELESELSPVVIQKIKERYKISDNDTLPPIQFFALKVQKDGSLRRITRS